MGDRRLELDGEHVSAKLLPGRGTNGGFSLVIEGVTQSHVNPRDPRDLQLEYTRMVASMIDGCREPGRPIRALHLGAGGLTIPRYVGATRPGSVQHVVELHRELLEFVLGALPLDDDVDLTIEYDDGRAAVERATRTGGGYDIAVVDVFSGSVSPRHMSTAEFFTELGGLLAPGGIIVVNTLATRALSMSREVGATLASLELEVVALAARAVVAGESLGNVVFAASDAPLDGDGFARRANDGSRPIDLLRGPSYDDFVDGASARRDGDAAA
ncbi:fused MFS/spermidine synthase [Agromyces sp. H66]|uniref:spermidine synthase n=1 Tax=Agromyces sp. H66 TaxID=2529859 RepID=UPI00145B301F|nr:fused MFS/spermidine synthase [Agromyces sp. H66]